MPITDEGQRRYREQLEAAIKAVREGNGVDPPPGPDFQCRFDVESTRLYRHGYEEVELVPVYQSGEETFADSTPSGRIKLSVSNRRLMGKLVPGQRYRVLFTPIAVADPARRRLT